MINDPAYVENLIRFLAAAHVSGCLHLQCVDMNRNVIPRPPMNYGGPMNYEPADDGTLKLEFYVCGQSVYDYENMQAEKRGVEETRRINETKLLS